MIKRLKKIGNKGSTIIEFALIFPVFLLLVFSIIEYSFIFMVRSWMEYSMSDISRYSKIYAATPQPGLSFDQAFKNRVASKNVLISPSKLVITDNLTGRASEIYDDQIDLCNMPGGGTAGCLSTGACPAGAISFRDNNGNRQCDDGISRFPKGNEGDVVIYRLIYKWDLFTPILSVALSDANGQHVIEVVGIVRNES